MLKKEFRKKDVNRARNLIMGKTGVVTGKKLQIIKKVMFGKKIKKHGQLKMV